MKVITYNGVQYTCTLSDRFRRHTPEELDAIRDTARRKGIRVAVRLYTDTDLGLENCVLDGEGRLSVAAELNLPPAKVPFYFEPEQGTESAYQTAKMLNDARRHDDPEVIRKRRLEKVAELRQEGKSLRAIAAEVGIDQKQVQRDLESGADSVRTSTPEVVTGTDGKTYPATKPTPPDPDEWDSWEPEEEADAPPLQDETPPQDAAPPQPAIDASRRRNPYGENKGGNKVDPNHLYADILAAMSNLSRMLTIAINAPEGAKLKTYLTYLKLIDHRDIIIGEKRLKCRFKGLGLRGAVRLAGRGGKVLSASDVLAACHQSNEEEGEE